VSVECIRAVCATQWSPAVCGTRVFLVDDGQLYTGGTSDPGSSQNARRRTANVGNPERLTGRHFVDYIPPTTKKVAPTRKCVVCCSVRKPDGKNVRKETRFYCPACDVGLWVTPCFKTITQRRTIECRSTCLLVTISLCHCFTCVVILSNFCASDCYLLSCLSRTEMKFAVLWAQVCELRVHSFIYLQCLCCNENKIMTPVYISARQTDDGDTKSVPLGE